MSHMQHCWHMWIHIFAHLPSASTGFPWIPLGFSFPTNRQPLSAERRFVKYSFTKKHPRFGWISTLGAIEKTKYLPMKVKQSSPAGSEPTAFRLGGCPFRAFNKPRRCLGFLDFSSNRIYCFFFFFLYSFLPIGKFIYIPYSLNAILTT